MQREVPQELPPIQDVVLIGLGAIGTLYASWIQRECPDGIRILADSIHQEKYRLSPPSWNGQLLHFHYVNMTPPVRLADLILIAVKSPGLNAALEAIAPVVGPHTQILPLLNGITSEERVAERYGWPRTLCGFHIGPTVMRSAGNAVHGEPGLLVFGEWSNSPPSPRVRRVQQFFDCIHLPYSTPEDMRAAIWQKYILNVGVNQASAVLRVPNGAFQTYPEARDLAFGLMDEAAAIAKAEGIPDVDTLLQQAKNYIPALPPDAKTSMLQDVEADRETEIELFAGTLIPLARKHHIPVPLLTMCNEQISLKSENIRRLPEG